MGSALFLSISVLVGLVCVYGTLRCFLALARPDLLLQINVHEADRKQLILQFGNISLRAYTLDLSVVECFALIRENKEGEYTAHIRNLPRYAITNPSPPMVIPSGNTIKMLGVLPDQTSLPEDCTRIKAFYSVKSGQVSGDDAWFGTAVSYPYVLKKGG